MSLRKIGFLILSFVLVFSSCKKDDGIATATPFDYEENLKADNDSIISYLETHYYNSSALGSNPSMDDIEITKLETGATVPSGSTLLKDVVEEDSYDIGDLSYKYYFLEINKGQGINSPTFSDNILIAYEGSRLLSGTVFDSRLNPNPSLLDITNLIKGWQLILPKFNMSQDTVDNGDGTITYNNPGVGMMFLPAGLGYLFLNSNNGLEVSPLIFKFELLKSFENDHDNDGIPSYLEELTDDQIFSVSTDETVIDDDTDGDGSPDYFDNDDDGDGVLTEDEITITTENRMTVEALRMIPLEANQELLTEITKEDDGTFTGTIITFTDTDGDDIPDYLDAE